LLTTQDRAGTLRRSLLSYRFYAGNLYLVDDGLPWAADLGVSPRATAQAHPGPLAVRRRPPTPEEAVVLGEGRWLVLEPTGEPVPPAVEPDLVGMWGLLAVALVLAFVRRRR
jgi:MYXO-CTERM domain-containing protein